MVVGENGILNRVTDASKKTNEEKDKEQRQLAMAEAAMNFENKEYTDKNGEKVTIPAGFAVSEIEGENTIKDGLVIIDSNGNEFVWIPVKDFENKFKRVSGYTTDGKLQNLESSEIDGEGNNSQYESELTKKEAKEMYASVKKNEGFYIGRYEAGKDENGNLVIQKNMTVYNNVPWSKIYKEDTGGAVELSRNLYKNSNIGVKSTLCYGVQWDATLNFIDNNYINSSCSLDSFCVNAKGKGWDSTNYFNGNPNHLTGIDLDGGKNCEKNIYDLAGNVSEFIMEFIKIKPYDNGTKDLGRVRRGTGFDYDKCFSSDRSDASFTGYYDFIGFRVALYLK